MNDRQNPTNTVTVGREWCCNRCCLSKAPAPLLEFVILDIHLKGPQEPMESLTRAAEGEGGGGEEKVNDDSSSIAPPKRTIRKWTKEEVGSSQWLSS